MADPDMRKDRRDRLWLAAIPAIIVAVGGPLVGYVLGQQATDVSTGSPRAHSIKLTHPEGPDIRQRNRLEGTVNGLLPGESVWTFDAFRRDPEKIYPLAGPCPVTDGRWVCDAVLIGDVVDKKKHSVWAAVLTDVQAARVVQALRRCNSCYMQESAREPQHADGEGTLDQKFFLRK